MAADVLFANEVIETCMLQLSVHFLSYSRKHNLDAFLLTHLAKVGKVVDTRRVNEGHLTHTDDAHFRTVAK